MDHNLPTSLDPFDFDPISLDDDLMQLMSNVFPQTPQNHDVSAVLNTSTENQAQHSHDNSQFTISNSFHASAHQLLPHHNVVEFNFASPPTPTPTPAPAPSKEEARKKKAKAVEIERKRRQEMSSLYQELQSVLPPGLIKRKKKLATSDLLQMTTNHIKNMEKGIKGLKDKRDELPRMMRSAAGNSSNSNTSKQQQNHHVTVKPCKDGLIEVTVSSALDDDDHENNNRGFRLSKILSLLGEEGLNVINCSSARIDSNLVHTIQAQVDDGRSIDLCLLRQILTDHS